MRSSISACFSSRAFIFIWSSLVTWSSLLFSCATASYFACNMGKNYTTIIELSFCSSAIWLKKECQKWWKFLKTSSIKWVLAFRYCGHQRFMCEKFGGWNTLNASFCWFHLEKSWYRKAHLSLNLAASLVLDFSSLHMSYISYWVVETHSPCMRALGCYLLEEIRIATYPIGRMETRVTWVSTDELVAVAHNDEKSQI